MAFPCVSSFLVSLVYMRAAVANCLKLLRQAAVSAASLALWRAGIRMEIRTAIIPTTTNNSTSVKPRFNRWYIHGCDRMAAPYEMRKWDMKHLRAGWIGWDKIPQGRNLRYFRQPSKKL